MLDPDSRTLYSNLLRPPPGYTFDGAVATTYSLDLSTLLTVPLYLVLFHGEQDRDALLRDPIALLEALRRTAARIRVFCQQGLISAPGKGRTLFALLEPVVKEAVAPNGGAFHPKLWLLRFLAADPEEPPLLRLAVLSRNLTADRSWDLALVLEGHPGGRRRAENADLAKLVEFLYQASEEQVAIPDLVDELRRTRWELPPGYEELRFHVLGLRRRAWRPAPSDRLAVISPFCSEEALAQLASTTREPAALISRPEELLKLSPEAWSAFGRTLVLAEQAETEDGEEAPGEVEHLRGLHAKAYIAKKGWNTHLYVGSANATNAALRHGQSVEVLAELVGRASQVGSIDRLLGQDGLGAVLEDFEAPAEPVAMDPALEAAELALESARRALAAAGLRLSCEGDADAWHVTLTPASPVRLEGIASIRTWLVTQPAEWAVDAEPLAHAAPIGLPPASLASISSFAAFEITASAAPRKIRFVLNLPIVGVPAARDAAVLRSVIQDRNAFLRYLMLLLSGLGESMLGSGGADGQAIGRGWGSGLPDEDSSPLLEDLTRALCRDPSRLRSIQRLVKDLKGQDQHDVVPEAFLELWDVFEAVVEEVA